VHEALAVERRQVERKKHKMRFASAEVKSAGLYGKASTGNFASRVASPDATSLPRRRGSPQNLPTPTVNVCWRSESVHMVRTPI